MVAGPARRCRIEWCPSGDQRWAAVSEETLLSIQANFDAEIMLFDLA